MKRLIFVLTIVWLSFACVNAQESYRIAQGYIFKTAYHIKYQHDKPLDNEIKKELELFDLSVNPFNPQSIISKVNNNEDVKVDSFFIKVFNKSQEISEKSKGKFDITCAPLVNLWGFGFKKERVEPSPRVVDSIRTYVGYKKIRLVGDKVVKKYPQTILNMSAIAKGYSCDVVARLLDSYGVQNYMVEIGGEITLKGKNPYGTCWRLEISKPDEDKAPEDRGVQTMVSVCNGGLATSGDYQNFYIKNGKKYAHTIDPTTGYPAGQNILSATVIAQDCMTADGYATAFMVLGLKKACKLGDSIPGLDYYFVYLDENGQRQIKYSKNMSQYLVSE